MAKMKFIGVLENTEHCVLVDDHDSNDGVYTIILDDKTYKVDAKMMPSEIVTALINNKSYDIDLDGKDHSSDPLDGRISVRVKGRVLRLEMLEERRKKMKDAQNSRFVHSGICNITSPMPGKILRYLVKEGEEVKEGQGLVVIEAMKMENEIQAPKSGIIKTICAKDNDAVEHLALLLVIA